MTRVEINHETSHRSRIPVALQAVFMASNRGTDVVEPPKERVAYKVFFNNGSRDQETDPSKILLNETSNDLASEGSTVEPELMDTPKVSFP